MLILVFIHCKYFPLSPCYAMLTIHGQFSSRLLIPSPQLSPINELLNKSFTVMVSSRHYSVFCANEFMPFPFLPPHKVLSTYSVMVLLQQACFPSLHTLLAHLVQSQ